MSLIRLKRCDLGSGNAMGHIFTSSLDIAMQYVLPKETEEVITAARAVHAGTPGRTKVARPGQFHSVLRGYRGEIRKYGSWGHGGVSKAV
jgi:hypothetical protein